MLKEVFDDSNPVVLGSLLLSTASVASASELTLEGCVEAAASLMQVDLDGGEAQPRYTDPGDLCQAFWTEYRTVNRNQYLNSGFSEWICRFGALGTAIVIAGWNALAGAVAGMVGAQSCSLIHRVQDYIIIQVQQSRACNRHWDYLYLTCLTSCTAWSDV